tara:strand:- start:426 stop:1697 length:1272 start_codon:yes stop_codon:yes gene_type:complete
MICILTNEKILIKINDIITNKSKLFNKNNNKLSNTNFINDTQINKNYSNDNLKNKQNLSYYKCDKIKNNGVTSNVLNKLDIQKNNNKYNSDLYMTCGYNYAEIELVDIKPKNNYQRIYAVKGCDKLVSKRILWKTLKEQLDIENAEKIMPKTYIIKNNDDIINFKLNYRNNEDIYILKSNLQRKRGLYLTSNYEDIMNKINTNNFKVIQEYMKDVYCIKKHKLNIRLYVVIICYEYESYWFLYKEGKCIYTNKPYDKVSSNNKFNLQDKEQHFTSYNLDTTIYKRKKLPESMNDLENYLGENKYHKLIIRIKNKLSLIKKAYKNKLGRTQNLKNNICFQLFGIDVVNNEYTLEPYILEFNKGPEMTIKSPNDSNLKNKLISDCFQLVLLNKNKLHLINDNDNQIDVILNELNTNKNNNWYIIN